MLATTVIKLRFVFSRKDAKTQSLEPISLRLRDFARAIFRKIVARNLAYWHCARDGMWI